MTDTAPRPARFAVGIDLGTTNSGLAAVALEGEEGAAAPPVAIESVEQVVNPGEVGERPLLPSFLYLAAEGELPAGSLDLPWAAGRDFAVGTFARDRGANVPGRLVSSAKSWLSQDAADRRAAILPWGAPDDDPGLAKVSPLEAARRYLEHLRAAWDRAHPDAPLAEQELVVTVPASFDAVARDLTVEAVAAAGLDAHLTLLEEPQAALYAWLADRGDAWRDEVKPGDLVLVCDLGGGTTDFSLIAAVDREGALELHRVAVGDHLLLGGDNMDLALAHAVKAKLEQGGKRIDDWQLRALTHGCRAAKETLLEDASLEAHPIVVPGRGSKLIGGTVRTELTRLEVVRVLLDGFFPEVGSDARPAAPRRTGLTTLGLPYATDAGVTRHLAAFLARPVESGASLPEGVEAGDRSFLHPTGVLFNGGVTRSGLLRDRVASILEGWLAGDGGQPATILAGADPDLAVARGAAYYGRVRRGKGIRIRGGSARAYYVGIERAELAVPGVPPRIDAVCVAPAGMEEGEVAALPQELGLVVGEPAAFRFFASSGRRDDAVADAVDPADGLVELPPIEALLQPDAPAAGTEGAASAEGQVVPVRLEATLTEVGTLDLAAVETGSGKRWRLRYDVRRD